MILPLPSLIAIGIGACVAMVGGVLLLIGAFRQSVAWGLVSLFVPFGAAVYACRHWVEARAGFLVALLGTSLCGGGLYQIPMVQERLAQLTHLKIGSQASPTGPSLDTQIQNQRRTMESLEAAFAKDGAELTTQYQALEAQRKGLKPADTAAITKFNATAAAYQARNLQRKQMQQDLDAAQKNLEALLDARSREAVAAARKVVMYTTSHCAACQAAKQYLAQKGVTYEEIDVEKSPEGAQAFQKLGGHGVPLILVGAKRVDGFSPQALDAALSGA